MEKEPPDLRNALAANARAKAQWKELTPIARRDFTTWIEAAKQPETRKRRIAVACSKLVAGERRPCCYAVVPLSLHKTLKALPSAKATWKTLSPDERRDFVDWVNAANDLAARAQRSEKTCALLSAGKRRIARRIVGIR
jgi:uncharacterized protein YdeI (YjbR/CyaY-like superfamily)